jgi:hypothetical protein
MGAGMGMGMGMGMGGVGTEMDPFLSQEEEDLQRAITLSLEEEKRRQEKIKKEEEEKRRKEVSGSFFFSLTCCFSLTLIFPQEEEKEAQMIMEEIQRNFREMELRASQVRVRSTCSLLSPTGTQVLHVSEIVGDMEH